MRRANRHGIQAILMLLIVVLAGAVAGVFGQGRGHDRGGGSPPGRGGGGGQPQRQVFNPGPQRQMQMSRPAPQQMQRQMPRFERPQIARPQPQPRYAPAPMQRSMQRSQQQPNRGWQNRGWQIPQRARIEQPRQQPQYRIERRPDFGRMRQQQNHVERRPDLGRMMQQQDRANRRADVGREMLMRRQSLPEMRSDRSNGRFDRSLRQVDRGIGPRDERSSSGWNRAWPNNYGYQRSNEVHARNAERQELREQENFWRERERNFGLRFNERDFESAYYRHRDFRDNVLRSVIANVFIGNTDNYYYYPPQYYDPYYYGVPYNPAYFDYGFYTPPEAYLYEPIYYAFPFGYAYYPEDYFDTPAYYDYTGFPDFSYGYSDDFPLAYFTHSSLGNVYITQMYGDLLAYGYEQGYLDGLYASQHSRYRDYYYDPFAFENAVYDPYSYTLGENRRCLSQGYEIGYQDALYGYDNKYDPYYVENNDDLVSLFIGTSLEM